jgi:hypothetical protein
MSRYFFDVNCGGGIFEDRIGHDFPTVDEAEKEAVRTLSELGCQRVAVSATEQFTISVRDNSGRKVMEATLNLAVSRIDPH